MKSDHGNSKCGIGCLADLAMWAKFIPRQLCWFGWGGIVIILMAWFLMKGGRITEKAFINYEQFQEIYNTCQKINTDLGIIKALPENDRMFDSFSKAAIIANKQQQLTRWVEEYNATSKMWHKSIWKGKSLPYQLTVNDFTHF